MVNCTKLEKYLNDIDPGRRKLSKRYGVRGRERLGEIVRRTFLSEQPTVVGMDWGRAPIIDLSQRKMDGQPTIHFSVGISGFEPEQTEPKSVVLPLHHIPISGCKDIINFEYLQECLEAWLSKSP